MQTISQIWHLFWFLVFLFGFRFLLGNYAPQPRACAETSLPRQFSDSLQTQTLACMQDFLFPISYFLCVLGFIFKCFCSRGSYWHTWRLRTLRFDTRFGGSSLRFVFSNSLTGFNHPPHYNFKISTTRASASHDSKRAKVIHREPSRYRMNDRNMLMLR